MGESEAPEGGRRFFIESPRRGGGFQEEGPGSGGCLQRIGEVLSGPKHPPRDMLKTSEK